LKHKVRIDDKKITIYYDENGLDSMLEKLIKK
jgi:hypothetical protein